MTYRVAPNNTEHSGKPKNRRCMQYCMELYYIAGFWPETSPNRRTPGHYFRSWFPKVMIFRMCYGLVFQAINLWSARGNMKDTIEFTTAFITQFQILVRLIIGLYYREDFKGIMDTFEQLHHPAMQHDDEIKQMIAWTERKSALFTKYFLRLFMAITYSLFIVETIHCFYTRKIPLKRFLPYEYHYFPVFEMTAISTSIFAAVDLTVFAVFELTWVGILMMIVEHFEVLEYKLRTTRHHVDVKLARRAQVSTSGVPDNHEITGQQRPVTTIDVEVAGDMPKVQESLEEGREERNKADEQEEEHVDEESKPVEEERKMQDDEMNEADIWLHENAPKMASPEAQKEMEIYLRHCVKHHQTLLWLVKEMCHLLRFSTALLVIVSASGGICFIYISTVAPEVDIVVIGLGLLFFSVYCILLWYCWYSNMLSEEAMKVRDAAYDCDWFGASSGFKATLRIIIARCERPLLIKGAGLTLSMKNFRLIMRAAFYGNTLMGKLYHGHQKLGLEDL